MSKTKVFLLCSGLGRINRGYESFTRECFEALVGEPSLDLTLFKGSGKSERGEITLWNLPRGGRLAERLGKLSRKPGYWIEQITFALSLLPYVTRHKPDVVYLSDTNIGNLLWHWRRLTHQRFKLLFSNGGPMKPPYPRWDFVQQLAPVHLEAASAVGQPDSKQTLLPYGIRMDLELNALPPAAQATLRESLNLPTDRAIVLSVGTVNKRHKRMDYVIREVAALPGPRPYLVILGQQDDQTSDIRALAEAMLGSDGYCIRTVPHGEVSAYYQASDIFVLASFLEGFGRVYLEAMSWGLPCLAHDSSLTRYVLGSSGLMADFEQPKSLTTLLCQVLQEGHDVAAYRQRHQDALNRFSWRHLRPQYVEMIQRCVNL